MSEVLLFRVFGGISIRCFPLVLARLARFKIWFIEALRARHHEDLVG